MDTRFNIFSAIWLMLHYSDYSYILLPNVQLGEQFTFISSDSLNSFVFVITTYIF